MEVKHMAELNLTNGMSPHCSFTWERVYVIKENTCEVDSLKVQCQFSTTEYFHHSPITSDSTFQFSRHQLYRVAFMLLYGLPLIGLLLRHKTIMMILGMMKFLL